MGAGNAFGSWSRRHDCAVSNINPHQTLVPTGAVNVLRELGLKLLGFVSVATRSPGSRLVFFLIVTLVLLPDRSFSRISTSEIVYPSSVRTRSESLSHNRFGEARFQGLPRVADQGRERLRLQRQGKEYGEGQEQTGRRAQPRTRKGGGKVGVAPVKGRQ